MRDEIPHGTAVVIERMREREGKDIMDIDATILCEKSSHKGMIIGKKGAMLKKIASESRTEIESFWKAGSICSVGSRFVRIGETANFPSATRALIKISRLQKRENLGILISVKQFTGVVAMRRQRTPCCMDAV